MSELYKRDSYINKEIPHIFHSQIYEYDMHHAGISIARELELLPRDLLDSIEQKAKNKKEIAVTLGKIQKKDSNFKKGINDGFVEMRKRFFESNEIEDKDVLSIKKDAIFVFRPCPSLSFGEVSFSLKHIYTDFVNTGQYEFYYNSSLNSLDVKGIDDLKLVQHEPYMITFIKTVLDKVETEGITRALQYIRTFSDYYKGLKLSAGYYRPFDQNGLYHTKDEELTYTDITQQLIPEIDISYNYYNVIVPMMSALL